MGPVITFLWAVPIRLFKTQAAIVSVSDTTTPRQCQQGTLVDKLIIRIHTRKGRTPYYTLHHLQDVEKRYTLHGIC